VNSGDVLRLVGERWALLVVREVSLGRRRFDELQVATGAPRAVLADRLRRLVESGILTTRPYRAPGSRARAEYVLTPAGIDLLPLQAALAQWSDRHLADDGTRDLDYRHIACGGRVSAVLVCECGQHVSPHQQLVAQINNYPDHHRDNDN
jgi:DNA-binding HxlR family transcriptional regulator